MGIAPALRYVGCRVGSQKQIAEGGMDVDDLRFFIAVYESEGFSRASEKLGTVQSNVSARIRSLEGSLGVPLFERRYRRVAPTARGDQLYRHARKVVSALNGAERAVKRGR